MKQAATKNKVRIYFNRQTNPNFGIIKDANTGRILHVGQPHYIRRIASERYNLIAKVFI